MDHRDQEGCHKTVLAIALNPKPVAMDRVLSITYPFTTEAVIRTRMGLPDCFSSWFTARIAAGRHGSRVTGSEVKFFLNDGIPA